jgi:hypothetical protein
MTGFVGSPLLIADLMSLTIGALTLLRGRGAEAPDAEAVIKEAIKQFDIKNPPRRLDLH